MQRLQLSSLTDFLAALRARALRAVAMQVVAEIRPRTDPGGAVVVAAQRWIDLTAYDAGTVLALHLDGDAAADPDAIERALGDAGVTVRRRSANVS